MVKGSKHSSDSKKKMSDAHKGEKNHNFGKEFSAEAIKNMSEAQKGHIGCVPWNKDKTGEGMPNYGKRFSDEWKKNISESMKGEKNPNFGKTRSEESKEKVRGENSPMFGKKAENHPAYKGGVRVSQKRYYEKQKEKRRNDLKFLLNKRISTSINNSLKKGVKNYRHWEFLVGYSYEQLKSYLEFTIPFGYSWFDFLSGELEVDHIIPVSAFDFDIPEHINFKLCWALKNLRLLPKTENRRKSNKIIKPFQMALKIAV